MSKAAEKLEKLERKLIEKAVELENAKAGNLELAYADRDEIAMRIDAECTAAVRELIDHKRWMDEKEPEPRPRDYIIGYLSDSLKDADFITPEIIEKMADIFLPLSPKPKFERSPPRKEKPAPESEKVLTAEEAWYISSDFAGIGDPKDIYMWAYGDARDNWRLERNIELSPLIEWATAWGSGYLQKHHPELLEIILNLKPLKAE